MTHFGIKYQILQSINYPFWWRNPKFKLFHSFYYNRKNPIYQLYFWSYKEKNKMDTAILFNSNSNISEKYILKEFILKKVNKYKFVPFYKLPFVLLFEKLKA